MNISQILSFFSNPSWDILVVFFLFASGFFYGISKGIGRLFSILLSLYLSVLLFDNFFYFDFLLKNRSFFESLILKLMVFLFLVVLLSTLFNKVVFKSSLNLRDRWWSVFVLSFFVAGVFSSSLFKILAIKNLFAFSSLVEKLFISPVSYFWWLVLSLLFLFFII